jgi:ribonuclease HI
MAVLEERTISVRPKSWCVKEQTVYPELSCYTDGASKGNPGPSACAYILVTGTGKVIEEQGFSLGQGTNNEAEYRGLIAGLSAAARYQCRNLVLFSDSELMVRQMQGQYRVTSPRLRPLHEQARALLSVFTTVTFHAVPREDPLIVRADQLCNHVLGA